MSDNDDIFARPATLEEWRENPLKVRDYELVEATDSKLESYRLSLTLKAQVHPEILDKCGDDGKFLFEFDRSDLIAMACDILGKLDPVTNEQVLEKIRNLVAPQNTSG